MANFRPVSKGDISIRKSSIDGAGQGLFCKRDLAAGTTFPYYGVVKKSSTVADGDDDYCMNISYTNERGKSRSLPAMLADGNPSQEVIASLPKRFRAAQMVNEPTNSQPNSILVPNPTISKRDIVAAYEHKKPVNVALLVIPCDLEKDEEIFTMYGSDYCARGYDLYDVDTEENDDNIDKAHDIAEAARELIAQSFDF